MGPKINTFFTESRSLVLSQCCVCTGSHTVVLVWTLWAEKAKSLQARHHFTAPSKTKGVRSLFVKHQLLCRKETSHKILKT